jgi:hypothetical protein
MKYLDNEDFRKRQGARLRLPVWLRFAMPIVLMSFMLATTALIVIVANKMFITLHPEAMPPFGHRTLTLTQVFLLFPPFMIGLPSSIILGNLFLWLIPPVRRILDQNARGVPGASFSQGMAAGRKMMIFAAVPGLILTFVGVWSPWLGS